MDFESFYENNLPNKNKSAIYYDDLAKDSTNRPVSILTAVKIKEIHAKQMKNSQCYADICLSFFRTRPPWSTFFNQELSRGYI